MKQILAYALLIIGISLSVGAVIVMAQDDSTPVQHSNYAGTRECRDCHRDITESHQLTSHALTMSEIPADDDELNPVVADFSTGEDVRTVTFPNDETRAFELDDVAFTLGVGRNTQTYLYDAGEGAYYVFPAEWRVQTQTWEPLTLDENWLTENYAFGANCAGCHTVGIDTTDYTWREEGVMCESCHGPGEDHVEYADDAGGTIDDEERALIYGSISLALDEQACGQCHSRGISEDGIHPYPTNYYPNANTALSDVFNVFDSSDDDTWFSTGHAMLPNMQYNETLESNHQYSYIDSSGRNSFVAECLACHSVAQNVVDLRLSNDDIGPDTVDALAIASELDLGVTCATCHSPHLGSNADIDAEEDPALQQNARLVADSYTLCITCHRDGDPGEGVHNPIQEVFEGIPVFDGLEVSASPHFSSDEGARCMTCHMPAVETYNGTRNSHTFHIVSPGDAISISELNDSCTTCHQESPLQMQSLIDDLQRGTRDRINAAKELIGNDAPEWVSIAIDTLQTEGSYGVHNYAYTSTLLNRIEEEVGISAPSLTDDGLVQQINDVLPDVEVVDTPPPTPSAITEATGLTTPSLLILALAAGILIFGAVTFMRSKF